PAPRPRDAAAPPPAAAHAVRCAARGGGARPPPALARPAAALARLRARVRPALPLRRRPGARAVGALGASPPLSGGGRRHLDRGPRDLSSALRRAGAAGARRARPPAASRAVGVPPGAAGRAGGARGGARGVRPPARDEIGAHVSIAGGLHLALERGRALGLQSVVIHPGSHLGTGPTLGLPRVSDAVREALRRTRGYRVRIALENTAGAGGVLGRTFAELGALLDRAGRPRRLGV